MVRMGYKNRTTPLLMGLALAALLSLMLVGCAKKEVARPKVPEMTRTQEAAARLEAGERAFGRGRFEEAEGIFADFLRRFADQPGTDLAWLRHGQIRLKRQLYPAAAMSFEHLLSAYPDSKHAPAARLGLAESLVKQDRAQEALNYLGGLKRSQLKPSQTPDYYQIVALARFKLGQPKAALVALNQGYRLAAQAERPEFADNLDRFIGAWPEKTLKELLPLYNSAFPAVHLIHGLAQKALAERDWNRALVYQKELADRFPDHPLAKAAGQPAGAPAAKETRVWTIGCLVPLNGPLADYGQRLLEGMQLAVGAFEADSPFNLAIEDTGDDPLVTTAALDRLASQHEAVAVVGPLSVNLAEAAGQRAQQLQIPLITLTQRREVAALGQWVLRDFITPSLMIEALAQRVVVDLNLRRVAILFPESTYGRRLRELMSQEVISRGGEIVRQVSYPPDIPDLGRQILDLGGQSPDQAQQDLPLPYDALFLPDDFRHAAQIAPQLAFYELQPAALLGTNLWHDPELIELAGRYVQGAIFPTAFFLDSDEEQVKTFVQLFRKTYERDPDLFAALGYDAVKLLTDLLRARPIQNRQELLENLLGTRGYPGVTGLTDFNDQGEAVKRPYLISVRGRRFVPAPTEPGQLGRPAGEKPGGGRTESPAKPEESREEAPAPAQPGQPKAEEGQEPEESQAPSPAPSQAQPQVEQPQPAQPQPSQPEAVQPQPNQPAQPQPALGPARDKGPSKH